jgi:peptidoglycan hydrolase FlgJ
MSAIPAINTQTIDPAALRQAMGGETQAAKLAQASKQFEAIFVRQFLSDALNPMINGSVNQSGAGNETYRYFVTDTLSQSLADKGAFGISRQLTSALTPKPPIDSSLGREGIVADSPQINGTASAIKAQSNNTNFHKIRI